jgi:hypothetical protein
MKHMHFIIHRLRSKYYYYYLLLLFFLDCSLPLSRLIIPNPHKKFKLEGRNVIFEGGYDRSVILKEGISDGILEVFVLMTLFFEVIMVILFLFIF